MATLPVIVNRTGGSAAANGTKLGDQLGSAFADHQDNIAIELVEGAQLREAIARADGAVKIVVGGGDGSVSSAAAELAGKSTVLALLPLGTLNHLARDLGIPTELAEAAKLAMHGSPSAIDLGNVNGLRFVNNASIGLYPSIVSLRDRYRARNGWPKWFASIPAAWKALMRIRQQDLQIDMGAGPRRVITPLLFVGNNIYSLEAGVVGTRASLSEGRFSVFAVKHTSRLSLILFALRAALGGAKRGDDFVLLGECVELTVGSARASTNVGIDGEVQRLEFPLKFMIEPAALNVIYPSA